MRKRTKSIELTEMLTGKINESKVRLSLTQKTASMLQIIVSLLLVKSRKLLKHQDRTFMTNRSFINVVLEIDFKKY